MSYQSESYERKDKTFKLPKYTSSKEAFYEATINFFKANMHERYRLLGIRCSALMREEDVKKQSIVNFLNGNDKKGLKVKQKVEESKEI